VRKSLKISGAQAIATTSAGVARAFGYPDGDALPTNLLATLAASITAVIHIPLSVDFEGVYTSDPGKVSENLKPSVGRRS
jgi:2-methylisocitrate lyase-like PEP mutase family enzyme